MGVKERVQDEWQRRRNSFRLLGFVLQAFLRVSCAIHMLWDDWFIYSKGTSSEWEISRALHTHERNEKPKFPWRQREEELLEKSLLSFSFKGRCEHFQRKIFSFPLHLSVCTENSIVACIIHFPNEIFIRYRVNMSFGELPHSLQQHTLQRLPCSNFVITLRFPIQCCFISEVGNVFLPITKGMRSRDRNVGNEQTFNLVQQRSFITIYKGTGILIQLSLAQRF